MTTVYELLHDRINLRGVAPLTQREYFVRGSTALLDAIGRSIDKIANAQGHTAESERAAKVLFVITTDGMENASREYRYDRVRQMIELQKLDYSWEFLFLGANIDAVETASRFGIAADRAANFHADSAGVSLNYEAVCGAVSHLRANRALPDDWKQSIDDDYQQRSRK